MKEIFLHKIKQHEMEQGWMEYTGILFFMAIAAVLSLSIFESTFYQIIDRIVYRIFE